MNNELKILNELFEEYTKLANMAIDMKDSETRFGYLEALRDVGFIIRNLTAKYDVDSSEDLQRYGENDEPQKVEIDRTGDYPNE